jgi:hypothetical protein
MASSGMLRRAALVRTDVSEEIGSSIIRVTRIGELGTLAVTSILRSVCRLVVAGNVIPSSSIIVILMIEALSSSETSVLTIATRRNIPEDSIHHSHRRENLKYYIVTVLSSSGALSDERLGLSLLLALQAGFNYKCSPLRHMRTPFSQQILT